MSRGDAGWALLVGAGGGLLHGLSMHASTGTMWLHYLMLSLVLGLVGGAVSSQLGFRRSMSVKTQFASAFLLGFAPATAYAYVAGSDNVPVLVGAIFGLHTLFAAIVLKKA